MFTGDDFQSDFPFLLVKRIELKFIESLTRKKNKHVFSLKKQHFRIIHRSVHVYDAFTQFFKIEQLIYNQL